MIIDFNRYNGGGSGSGSTDLTNYWNSAVTEQHIESAASITYASAASYTDQAVAGIDMSGFYTSAQTEDAITEAVSGLATEQYVQDALSGVNLDNYWTSAQTEDAISAATSGKADAASVSANTGDYVFPAWNEDGVVTGVVKKAYKNNIKLNNYPLDVYGLNSDNLSFFAPTAGGTAGQVLVSAGNGTPVWSAMPAADVTKAYVDSAATNLQDQIDTMDEVVSQAILDLNDRVDEISAATPTVDLSNYYTSAQTEDAISAATSGKADAQNVDTGDGITFPTWNRQGVITGRGQKGYTNSITINGVSKSYWGRGNGNPDPFYAPLSAGNAGEVLVSTGNGAPVWSAATQDMVTSTDVKHIVKLTQAAYDQLVLDDEVDPYTFYIIVSQSS